MTDNITNSFSNCGRQCARVSAMDAVRVCATYHTSAALQKRCPNSVCLLWAALACHNYRPHLSSVMWRCSGEIPLVRWPPPTSIGHTVVGADNALIVSPVYSSGVGGRCGCTGDIVTLSPNISSTLTLSLHLALTRALTRILLPQPALAFTPPALPECRATESALLRGRVEAPAIVVDLLSSFSKT